jgi:4-amino-4-deoxychorismate lyase
MVPMTLVDGVLADSIPVSDRGLLYGDGVFETVRYRQQQLVRLPAHLLRLQRSCEQLGIPVRMADIEQYIDSLLRQVSSAPDMPADGIVKIIVTRGDGGRGYMPPANAVSRSLVQFHLLPAPYADFSRHGISCMLCQHPVSSNPVLGGLKHLNRLDQVLASQELAVAQNNAAHSDSPLQEGLMFDSRGSLIEGTKSNVFAVLNNQLHTPDLSQAGVCGIMRNALLEWFAGQGIQVAVTTISAEELMLATEVFICNSVIGIWPVNCVYDFTSGARLHLPDQATARRAQQGLLSH